MAKRSQYGSIDHPVRAGSTMQAGRPAWDAQHHLPPFIKHDAPPNGTFVNFFQALQRTGGLKQAASRHA
jgi:hypothetical protein